MHFNLQLTHSTRVWFVKKDAFTGLLPSLASLTHVLIYAPAESSSPSPAPDTYFSLKVMASEINSETRTL